MSICNRQRWKSVTCQLIPLDHWAGDVGTCHLMRKRSYSCAARSMFGQKHGIKRALWDDNFLKQVGKPCLEKPFGCIWKHETQQFPIPPTWTVWGTARSNAPVSPGKRVHSTLECWCFLMSNTDHTGTAWDLLSEINAIFMANLRPFFSQDHLYDPEMTQEWWNNFLSRLPLV